MICNTSYIKSYINTYVNSVVSLLRVDTQETAKLNSNDVNYQELHSEENCY